MFSVVPENLALFLATGEKQYHDTERMLHQSERIWRAARIDDAEADGVLTSLGEMYSPTGDVPAARNASTKRQKLRKRD